jgi:hypothetical protein
VSCSESFLVPSGCMWDDGDVRPTLFPLESGFFSHVAGHGDLMLICHLMGPCERGTPASTRCTYDRLFQTFMVRKPRTFQGSCAVTDHFMIGLGILTRSHLYIYFFFIFLRRCSLEQGGAVRCLDHLKRGMGDIQRSLDRRSQ